LTLATGVALWVELLLVKFTESADLIGLLDRRLACVEDLIQAYAQGRSPDAAKKELARLSTLGTSRLRNILQRSPHSRHYREQMGAVVGLVGNLINLSVELRPGDVSDRERVQALAVNVGRIRADLLSASPPPPVPLNENAFSSDSSLPLERMEITVSLIDEMLTAHQSLSAYELQQSKSEQASRHQHGSHHMLFDRVGDNRRIPSKTDPAANGGRCWGPARSGVAVIRSALY